MTKNEFVIGMSILKESTLVNTVSFNKANLALWYVYFKNHEYSHFIVAVITYIAMNKFYPTISDLLSGIDDVINYNKLLQSPEDAWHDLENCRGSELAYKMADESGITISIDRKLVITDEGARRRFLIFYKAYVKSELSKKCISQTRDTVELIKGISVDAMKSLANTKNLIKELK